MGAWRMWVGFGGFLGGLKHCHGLQPACSSPEFVLPPPPPSAPLPLLHLPTCPTCLQILDFVDPDIDARLEALEREEDALAAAYTEAVSVFGV